MSLWINKCFMRCVWLYMPSIKWRKKGKAGKRRPSADCPWKCCLHLFIGALKKGFALLPETLKRKRFKNSKSKFDCQFRRYQMALKYEVFPCAARLWSCGLWDKVKSHLFLHVEICAWTSLDIPISTKKPQNKTKHQNQTKNTKIICFFSLTHKWRLSFSGTKIALHFVCDFNLSSGSRKTSAYVSSRSIHWTIFLFWSI